METAIVGREMEQRILQDVFESGKSEFVTIYGRRRVGKTFLVREMFADKFVFEMSGLANANTKSQLLNFTLTLNKTTGETLKPARNWLEAFDQLVNFVEQSKQKRKVLFFDETPWMDTPRSDFLTAFEHFWNAFCSARKDIVLLVCGSATSWIINNLINNHGGLHNRLTTTIFLKPFTLLECEKYFKSKKIEISHRQIAECYMIMGGIPFYLSKIKKGLSIAQNIDNLFFDEIPWMDTPRSEFLAAFEHFWNAWASARKDIVLIVCGSATSWIINNLINNHGGLHNRLTTSIFLKPFTLLECEKYFKRQKISTSRMQIAEYYMIMGGIPFYLSKIQKGLSAAQNIDNLFFAPKSELRDEFRNLYASLFRKSDDYIRVVETLSKKGKGLTRNELETTAKIKSGGTLTKILQNLEYCDFIRKYVSFDKKKRDMLYQLIDPFYVILFQVYC
jgi:AAA+ ATPase superfamily predicted ATPase